MSRSTSESSGAHPKPSETAGFFTWRPGRLAYRDALALQERLIACRPAWTYDLLLLLEHPPVVTLGRRADTSHLLWTQTQLSKAGFDVFKTSRGGDVTLHNPGQLVGYPIVDLNRQDRNLHQYLRRLEAVLLETLATFGIAARTISGKTGVWVADRKIASIGVAVRKWIAWHGFALNISNDLSEFDSIVPCGLRNISMTSMNIELGTTISPDDVCVTLIEQFGQVFSCSYWGEFGINHEFKTAAQT